MTQPMLQHVSLKGIWMPGDPVGAAAHGARMTPAAWPTRTDKACFYCAHEYDTQPVPLFANYDYDTDTYQVFGQACSAACAKMWFLEKPWANVSQMIMRQRELLVRCFGWPADEPLPLNKDKCMLRKFWGDMSIDEWRAHTGPMVVLKDQQFVPHRAVVAVGRLDSALGTDVGVQTDADNHLADQHAATTAATTAAAAAADHDRPLDNADADDAGVAAAAAAAAQAKHVPHMARPPPEGCVTTEEQLAARFPEALGDKTTQSAFENYIRTCPLPSEAEATELRLKMQRERKLKRKRKLSLNQEALNTAPPPMVAVLEARAQEQTKKLKHFAQKIIASAASATSATSAASGSNPNSSDAATADGAASDACAPPKARRAPAKQRTPARRKPAAAPAAPAQSLDGADNNAVNDDDGANSGKPKPRASQTNNKQTVPAARARPRASKANSKPRARRSAHAAAADAAAAAAAAAVVANVPAKSNIQPTAASPEYRPTCSSPDYGPASPAAAASPDYGPASPAAASPDYGPPCSPDCSPPRG